jgi:hypothetical protein
MVAIRFPETSVEFPKLNRVTTQEVRTIPNLTFLQKGQCTRTLLTLKSNKFQPLSAYVNQVSVTVTESRGNLTGQ